MRESIPERRDLPARAACDQLGHILHIDRRDLVHLADAEATSMIEAILDERERNRSRGQPLHASLLRRMGMNHAVAAIDLCLRRPSSLLSKGSPPPSPTS